VDHTYLLKKEEDSGYLRPGRVEEEVLVVSTLGKRKRRVTKGKAT